MSDIFSTAHKPSILNFKLCIDLLASLSSFLYEVSKLQKIAHYHDKKIQQESICNPADYILWDSSRILVGEMFGETLLQEKKSNSEEITPELGRTWIWTRPERPKDQLWLDFPGDTILRDSLWSSTDQNAQNKLKSLMWNGTKPKFLAGSPEAHSPSQSWGTF